MKLGDIAKALGGRLVGDSEVELLRVSSLESAAAGSLAFLANPRYKAKALSTSASAVVCSQSFAGDFAHEMPCPVVAVENPLLSMVQAIDLLWQPLQRESGQHELAYVHPQADLAEDVSVMPFAYVGRARIGARTRVFPHAFVDDEVEIGADCQIRPGCVLLNGTVLGDRVLLHPGVALGGDGFGFAGDGPRHVKVPQIGGVELGDDVEVGSLCAIDRGSFDPTRVGTGAKIDNLVQVGHNVQVGENAILVAQVGIAGSTTIGDSAVLAGKVGVNDHVTVGNGARVGAYSAIAHNIPENGAYSGIPAMPHGAWLRMVTHSKNLEKTVRRLRKVERRLEQLEAQGGAKDE